MTQLYKLTEQLIELSVLADTEDEGLKDAIQTTMDAIQEEFDVKAEHIVMLRRNLEGDIGAIKREIERLTALKRSKEGSVDAINDYLRRSMEALDKKSIKRPLFTITLATAPEKVVIDKDDDIPDDYVSVSTSVTPDKKAIAARIKEVRDHNAAVRVRMEAGEDCESELLPEPSWAHLERGENSIRIK